MVYEVYAPTRRKSLKDNKDNSQPEDSTLLNLAIVGVKPLFQAGRVVVTQAVTHTVHPAEAIIGLVRHLTGDWGNVSGGDAQSNDLAIEEGSRIMSSYETLDGVVFWIITEADRSATTILLPDDY